MAFSSGVFTSTSGAVNGDGIFVGNKANTAAQLAKEKKMLYGNGISLDPTSAFYVAPKTGLTATVSAGWGIMEGYWFEESADYDITMTSSVSEQTLYIGVRLDVATGEYTDGHVAARTTFVPATDRVFAIIVIPANAVTLTSGMITDTRNNSTYCGTVNAQRAALAALQAEYTEKLEVLEATSIPIHASTHATGESDEIIPTSIGAMPYDATSTNLLINGGFDIWQRGTSLSAGTGGYIADRWNDSAVTATIAPSRQAFTVGQTDVPDEPTYYHRAVVVAGDNAASLARTHHRIEDVRILAGRTVTISFWVKADASKYIAIEFLQSFGSGGSPSAFVSGIGAEKIAVTTSWQKITRTIVIPSISGKTLGSTANSSYTQFEVWYDAGADNATRASNIGYQSGTFDLANVQLNYGSVALPFVPRSYADELMASQRYYLPITTSSLCAAVHYSGNPTFQVFVPTPVTMRANPTVLGSDKGILYIPSNALAPTSMTAGALKASGVTLELGEGSASGLGSLCVTWQAGTNGALDAEL